MAVDDHGLEVLKKSGEEVTPGDKSDYYIKVSEINPSSSVAKTNPNIYNIPITTAGVEQSQALSPATKSFIVRSRNAANIQLSFVSGQSGSNYFTLKPNAVYEETGVNLNSTTLYFQSDTDNTVLEILEWT